MSRRAEPDDERLREALSSALEALDRGEECPDEPEEIWRAAKGELPRHRTSDLLRHSTRCPTCALAWNLAAVMAGEETSRVERPTEARAEVRPPGVWLWPAVGLGTVGLAAAVLLVAFLRGPSPNIPAFRSPREIQITSLVPLDGAMARDRFVLRWTPGPAGTRYTVEVTTEELVLLHRSRVLTQSQYQIPEGVLERLPAGTGLLWRVEATLPEERMVRSAVSHATLK